MLDLEDKAFLIFLRLYIPAVDDAPAVLKKLEAARELASALVAPKPKSKKATGASSRA